MVTTWVLVVLLKKTLDDGSISNVSALYKPFATYEKRIDAGEKWLNERTGLPNVWYAGWECTPEVTQRMLK
jgi:hypothetical protein